jgi:hypothetical protein
MYGGTINYCRILFEKKNVKEGDQLGELSVDERLLLKLILNKQNVRLWAGGWVL